MIRDQFQLDFSDFDNWRFGVWLEEQKGRPRDETILLRTVIANTLWQLWINKNDCHYHNHQINVHVLFWKIVSATIDFLNNIQYPEGNDQTYRRKVLMHDFIIVCDGSFTSI